MFEKHLQLCVLGLRDKKEKTMWHYVAKASTRHRKAQKLALAKQKKQGDIGLKP